MGNFIRKQRIFTVIVGEQGRGKSELAKKMLSVYRGKHVLIYDHPGDDTFAYLGRALTSMKAYKGGRKRINKGHVKYEDFLKYVRNHIRHSLIVISDATGHEVGLVSEELRKLAYEIRHYDLDLLYLFHNSRRIPIEVMENAHYFIKFKEGQQFPEKRFSHLNEQTLRRLRQLWDKVEHYETEHPDDPLARYFCASTQLRKTQQ